MFSADHRPAGVLQSQVRSLTKKGAVMVEDWLANAANALCARPAGAAAQ